LQENALYRCLRSYAWITFSSGFLDFVVVPAPAEPVVEAPVVALPVVPVVEAPVLLPVPVVPGPLVVEPAPLLLPAGAVVVAPAFGAVVPGTPVVPTPAAVVPAVLTPGTPVVAPAGPAAAPGVVVAPAAGAVTVCVTATVPLGPLEPASDTSAAVRAPSESTITVVSAITGGRHRGVAARRVRAAAPHRKHHSCSDPNGPPHSGQRSSTGACGGVAGGAGVASLTPIRPAGG
jgi:hypothetical protein